MTKNKKSVIMFSVCTIAVLGILYLTTVREWNTYHVIGFIVCVIVILLYLYCFLHGKA